MGRLSRRKGITGILLTALVLCALVVPAVAMAEDGGWHQFHKDAANIGYSTSEAPDTAELLWVSGDIGAKDSSSVAVAEGKVFVFSIGEDSSGVCCLEETTGAVLWNTQVAESAYFSWASPSYHDGKIFISVGEKTVCLNATDGQILWEFTNPSGQASVNGGPAIGGGKVFCSDWDGHHYYCLDESTGGLLWTFDVPGYAQGTPAYAVGKVYFTSWEYVGDHTYCVDAETGVQIWHQNGLDWDTCGSPCVADGKVFVTTYNFYDDGEIAAMNASSGAILWQESIQRSDSTPAYTDGKVYVCGGCVAYSNSQTYCFNADTGNLIWQTPTSLELGDWTCSVAVADGKVFSGKSPFCGVPGIYALDATDGSDVWHYDEGGSSPAVADGLVFTSGGGKVWAFGSIPSQYPDWDVNEDGDIDTQDIVMVGNHWGETGTPGWIREDVNSDGNIDTQDIVVIGMHWG